MIKMRRTTKLFLSCLLSLALILSAAGCGASGGSETPNKSRIQDDVQDYITNIVDEGAKISFLSLDDSNETDGEFTAVCVVNYQSDTKKYIDRFNVSYQKNGSSWEVNKIAIDTGYEGKSVTDLGGDTTSQPVESKAEQTASKGELSFTGDLKDFVFLLDGVGFQLPCPYRDFKDAGWTIAESGTFETNELSGESEDDITIGKSGSTITATFTNPSGNKQVLADCVITSIDVTNQDVYDPKCVCIGAIDLSSTADDIIKAFGQPTAQNVKEDSRGSYTEIGYIYSDTSGYIFTVYDKDESKQYNTMVFGNDSADGAAAGGSAAEVSTEVPEYLSAYKAPTELGDDPTSGNYQIGGDVYTMPTPVSAFLDNGWKVTQKEGGVPGGGDSKIKLQKGEETITAYVKNFADYKTIPENCTVTEMEETSYTTGASFTLPGNVMPGTSVENASKALSGKLTESKSETSLSYYYRDDNLYVYVYCVINDESNKSNDKVYSIRVKGENMNWTL